MYGFVVFKGDGLKTGVKFDRIIEAGGALHRL